MTNGQLPRPARALKRPVLVRSPEILQAVMEAASDPAMVPFGAAVPGRDAIPAKKLNSIANAMIRRHGADVYQYSMAPGRHELRAAVSRRLLAAGVKASPEEIVATQGASEALALERGIGLIPGSVFSASCRLKRCLRLSCGAGFDERAAKAIRTLGRLALKCRDGS